MSSNSQNYATIRSSIQSKFEDPFYVLGGEDSFRAYVLARALSEGDLGQPVIVCSSGDHARTFAQDLEEWLRILTGRPTRIAFVPTWDRSPYSGLHFSIRTKSERANALAMIHSNQWDAVVTYPGGLTQATLPPGLFRSLRISVQVGQTQRDSLLQGFQDAGYARSDLIEDPGQFGVRGSIIDIFPCDADRPFRLEFFGDDLERIRSFDPATQRTLAESDVQSLEVYPCLEALRSSETLEHLKHQLKEFCDARDISKQNRDVILQDCERGLFPDTYDAWVPFLYSEQASLLDHLRFNRRERLSLIRIDQVQTDQEWEKELEGWKKEFEGLSNHSGLLPPPDLLYRSNTFIESHSLDRIVFDQVAFQANPGKPLSVIHVQVDSHPKLTDRQSRWDSIFQSAGTINTYLQCSTESHVIRVQRLLSDHGIVSGTTANFSEGRIGLRQGSLSSGFSWPDENLSVFTDEELFGEKIRVSRSGKKGSAAKDFQELADLATHDIVVHHTHGIGKYMGLVRLKVDQAESDFLLLEYAQGDKLYLPVYRLDQIHKYHGANSEATLDKLGSNRFDKAKDKARESVRKLAVDLVELYAQRSLKNGEAFSLDDASLEEMESAFHFDETPDQAKAIQATFEDLASGKIMDRLVCGDVGFGKTEVAMRAAFLSALHQRQVAVLVPTTLLAIQHEASFRQRLEPFGAKVRSLSRIQSPKEQKEILELLKNGQIDILIGTHRLLGREVKFKNLGLIIVDEEHRFGVDHKEKLKALKISTHVLTLTATPIPRTLHMALSGLRDISLITTPPIERLPVKTYVARFDETTIRDAIEFELNRGGQVFFMHNRVQTIHKIEELVNKLVPRARVGVVHGQMSEADLEKGMLDFYEKRTHVLVCTSIIESGLDIPNANTILIDQANTLGLAQLYQLRGRVGRSGVRAHAYLLVASTDRMTKDAQKRLEVIQRFVELGSGFQIASHDLEIRGGGDLLGADQSGHIGAIGFDLYLELLEEAVQEIRTGKRKPAESLREPEIKVPYPSFFSEDYIPDVQQRLSTYRRLSGLQTQEELHSLEEELGDRYGKLPPEAMNLFWVIRLKLLLLNLGVEGMTLGKERWSIQIGNQHRLNVVALTDWIRRNARIAQVTQDQRLILFRPHDSLPAAVLYLEETLRPFALAK